MRNLIFALSRANLTESTIESVLTEFDIWIDSKTQRSEEKLITESIAPIQRETDGLRGEVRNHAETMKNGFELLDRKLEERFTRMDQKLDLSIKNLVLQIASNREYSELQISRIEKQINSTRDSLEKQIISTRENLETQIKAYEKSMDKQFSFQQKLL